MAKKKEQKHEESTIIEASFIARLVVIYYDRGNNGLFISPLLVYIALSLSLSVW